MCICCVSAILSGTEGVKLRMQFLQDLPDVKRDLLVPAFCQKAKQQWPYSSARILKWFAFVPR